MICETARVSEFIRRRYSPATHIQWLDVRVHDTLVVEMLEAQEDLTQHRASCVKAEHFLHEHRE